MSSRLETIPLDVLSYIAFFTTEPAPLTRLGPLRQLLLCSRTLHGLLSIQTRPELYARIFRVSFDLGAYCRRCGHHAMTSTWLAEEFQRRRRVLRRIRLGQVAETSLFTDLLVIYVMLLESDTLNEMHLHDAGVSKWVTDVLARYSQATSVFDDQVAALAIAVASMVWSHIDISGFRTEDRNQILDVICPFTTHTPLDVSGVVCPPSLLSIDVSRSIYNGMTISVPNLSSSAIFLTFALKELMPLEIPPHLPDTRAEADAMGNSGPTKEDFHAITAARTQLVADSFHHNQRCGSGSDLSRERQRPSRSMMHDEDFSRISRCVDLRAHSLELEAYFPGLATGVWEGSYMVALCSGAAHPVGLEGDGKFLCRRPIQFQLDEYLTFTPWLPLPIDPSGEHAQRNFDVSARDRARESAVELSDGNTGKAYHYEPFGLAKSGRNARHALDVVITGETPRRFQPAWGAFKFTGRVRLSDGLITLTREPQDEGDSGTWVFQGYLRSRRTFVGRWNTLGRTNEPSMGGIFSVSKTTE